MGDLAGLGIAAPDADLLRSVVRAAVGDPEAEVDSARATASDYHFTSIATGGLWHVAGTARSPRGPRSWASFVKILQHPRHWDLIDLIPPAAAEEMKQLFPWRDELEVRAQVLPVLPPGLRVPEIYRLADLGDDRLAVWMEDIDVDDTPWSDESYSHAARLLARLAARRTPGTAAGACAADPGLGVRKVVESRGPRVSGMVADHALWARPLVVDAVDADLRTDLAEALDRLPDLLTEMATLPTSLPHGDAAPANLLRPRGEPDSFVAVDWSFSCQLPLGHDLGQLLVGEAERGRMEPAALPGLLDLMLRAYVDGLTAEGLDVHPDVVRRGMVCSSLGPRTMVGAFPFERTEEPPTDELRTFLRLRAGLARFVVDQVLD